MNTAAKIATSVWAKRLSKSLEQQSGLEGSQKGFRPDRFTRRQISRFISALQDVERNQGTICVTFLDFENYFNTIFLPALFLLLRKFGMNENDVQALESYYEHLRKQRHSLKLGKKRRESSKRNYYIISPRVLIKAIIIITCG